MPNFAEIFKNIVEFFTKLTMMQKLMAGGIVVVVIAAILGLSMFSGQSTYSFLYSKPLAPEEYAKVTKALEGMSVQFKTKDDQFILVKDEEEAQTYRMKLGQAGIIPDSVKGYELFDIQSFTITDFERDVNLQRAIRGQIIKHLKRLDDIEDVSVEISFPKETLYSDKESPITASVIIKPREGVDLNQNKAKVKGIVNLVSKGIPGLSPDNITVADTQGNILSDLLVPNDLSDAMMLAREQLRVLERERTRLIARIRNDLDKTGMSDRLMISADIEFDWTKKTMQGDYIVPTYEKKDNPMTPYDDSKTVLTISESEKTTEEKLDSSSYLPEGAPGVDNNIPGGLKDLVDHFNKYIKNERILNNAHSSEKVEEVKAPYELKRLTVSVAIDGVWKVVRNDAGDEIVTNGGEIARVYTPVGSDELKTFQSLVEAAVGYNASRGDVVNVRHLPFDHRLEFENDDAKIRGRVQLRRTLIAAIIVLFFLFIGTLVYRVLAREMERRRRLREEELARQQQAMREAALRAAEEESATVELSIEEKARMELLENAINLSRERPEDVARLIKTWLAEE